MRSIEITDGQILIDGTSRVLLVASLFPFRVPRSQWIRRIEAVKNLGYDGLDVYIPWNYHEYTPGNWDFEGGRDISAFLDAANDAGLLVLARPGPYICSEWDGGGLPAWLPTIPGLRLRQNEPTYLGQVGRWFDHILPILSSHQYTNGGPVIMVQLENELDFFDCDDPSGYMQALVDMARARGISVPLVACAGQGDVSRATGDVPGVVPAVNLYPSDDSDQIEQAARYYGTALAERGYPLIVTETNRAHRTLKRLVASGAKLLGPYLQASGWNMEYGTSINNWGDPLGFMTHDYDFGGALDPNGDERCDAGGARTLAHVIHSLGERLARAVPGDPVGVDDEDLVLAALNLDGGGQLLSLTNLTTAEKSTRVSPRSEPIVIPPESTVLVVRDVVDGEVVVTVEEPSTAELPHADTIPSQVEIMASDSRSGWVVHRSDCQPAALENEGIYRGAGRYEVDVPVGTRGLILRSAADIVDVRCGEWCTGWFANGGTDAWVPLPCEEDQRSAAITTRVWGHSNFDDGRLPSLRLGSCKGLTGIMAVRCECDISSGWTVSSVNGPRVGSTPPPLGGLGWISSTYPQTLRYTRSVGTSGCAAVRTPSLHTRLEVALNGELIGTMTPLSTTLWIGPVSEGDEISVTVTKLWGEEVGDMILLTGENIAKCQLSRQDTATLCQSRDDAVFAQEQFPVHIQPGEALWLRVPSRFFSADAGQSNAILRAFGEGLLITALSGQTNLGRLWVGDMIPGAQLRGGQGDILLIPTDDGNGCDLLLEATGDVPGVLTSLTVGGPLDQ